ncbi:MAG: pilin [Patescibacteria group bacterium]
MKKNIFKINKLTHHLNGGLTVVVLIFILSIILMPNFASADIVTDSDGIMNRLGDFAGKIDLPGNAETTTPITIIINVINVALGLLGLFFVILIMYGGFTWMTAQGDAEKVKKAQGIIKNSIYGVAIILLSLVIVNVVVDMALKIAEGDYENVF